MFAYGQTGSGKTYTMGSGFDMAYETDTQGMFIRINIHTYVSEAEDCMEGGRGIL